MKTECVNKMLSNKTLGISYQQFLSHYLQNLIYLSKYLKKVCNHLNTPFSLNTYVTYILLRVRIQFDRCLERNYYSTMVAVLDV